MWLVSFVGPFLENPRARLGLLQLVFGAKAFLLGSGYIFTVYYHDSVPFPETWSLCLTSWCPGEIRQLL